MADTDRVNIQVVDTNTNMADTDMVDTEILFADTHISASEIGKYICKPKNTTYPPVKAIQSILFFSLTKL